MSVTVEISGFAMTAGSTPIFSAAIGSMLPIGAEKIGVDPAVMANPLISTVTDTVSLLIYIYMAKLILHI